MFDEKPRPVIGLWEDNKTWTILSFTCFSFYSVTFTWKILYTSQMEKRENQKKETISVSEKHDDNE